MRFTIFDCTTRERVSPDSYATAEEANHDYHMNQGHTFVGPMDENGKLVPYESRTRLALR